jgi:prophage regulatory protein
MPHDMLDRIGIDPGHRTLGELIQERQWAVHEISRLRDEVARLSSRRGVAVQDRDRASPPAGEVRDDPLAARRLLRLADVVKLVSLSRSTIWRLMRDGRFPSGVHFGPRAVRWRAADVFAWQDRVPD